MLCRGVGSWLPKYCIYCELLFGAHRLSVNTFWFLAVYIILQVKPSMNAPVGVFHENYQLSDKLEKNIGGNCKVSHPGKFRGKQYSLLNFA